MKKMENKVAVVTGGNSGIGYATAKEFLTQGAKVIITGRNKQFVDSASKALGITGIVCDQSDTKDIFNVSVKLGNEFKQIDALVINAAVGLFAPIGDIDEGHYEKVMNTNFKGALFTLQYFLPMMSRGASVVFVSSSIAYTGSPNSSVYNASKAALNSLAKTSAFELAPRGIRVNVVCPGVVDTPILGKTGFPDEMIKEFKEGMKKKVPLSRFGTSDEIAKLIAFLSSEDASYITGSDYIADGGLNLNPLVA
jgi:NAD(P)-dependent dehydrogenase (short-subunit alcohol dehydrogenase family)